MTRTAIACLVAATAALAVVPPAAAQEEDPSGADAYRQAVRQAATRSREEIRRRGSLFLDAELPVERRLRSVDDVSELMAPEQLDRAKGLVFEREAPVRSGRARWPSRGPS